MTQPTQEPQRLSKDGLKNQALTERIAQLVAQYEDGMAELRANATVAIEDLQQENARLSEELAAAKESGVQKKSTGTKKQGNPAADSD